MTKEEITHLAKLARIELSDKEVDDFTAEISVILQYVGTIQDIVGDDIAALPKVGVRHNIFRKDEVTNEPDQHTAALLAEMPKTEGRYMVVKKILNTES